mgnify:FL=1
MTFDKITDDGRLWAVRYDGADDNALVTIFDQWNDIQWLREFFKATMQERNHTLQELINMEKVRQFLIENHVIDEDAFVDYMNEL